VPLALGKVGAICCGTYVTVVLTEDGRLVCWGYNDSGQCDVPDTLAVMACGNVLL
jgi:alpha-tubulin suppressor-like RCC1 family protein